MPSFEEPYALLTLPRIPDLPLNRKIVIANISSIDSNVVDLGISKSIISSYIIKPTPKLIWSYALSPTITVDCMDVCEDSNKTYIVGTTERNKYHKLLLLIPNNESETTTIELKLSCRAKGVKFFDSGKKVVAVLSDGSVQTFDCGDELVQTDTHSSFAKGELAHFEFVKDFPGSENDFLLIVSELKNTRTYQTISLTGKYFEVNSHTENSRETLFSYTSGYMYELDATEKKVYRRPITTFRVDKEISVAPLVKEKVISSFHAPAVDRLVLSVGDKMHLVNFKFASLLDTLQGGEILVNQVLKVEGNTARSEKSMLFYLDEGKDKNIDLNVLNFSTGLNILSECLGNSFEKQEGGFHGLTSLDEDDIVDKAEVTAKEVNEMYSQLQKYATEKDVAAFDKTLVSYLKNKEITDMEEFQEFDVDSDRVVDGKFIEKVLELVFKRDEDNLVLVSTDFVPEFSLIYLLTNPIFPGKYAAGLLSLFNTINELSLFRQAINTCPNLPLNDLLVQLLQEEDTDIFQDLINRLVNEFSINSITKALQEVAGEYDLTVFLNRALNSPYSVNNWLFIELLIDVGGLFSWSSDVVEKLSQIVNSKVETLLENSYNLTLTKQSLAVMGPVEKKKKKNKIVAQNMNESRLDGILKLQGGMESKKVATYSIERIL